MFYIWVAKVKNSGLPFVSNFCKFSGDSSYFLVAFFFFILLIKQYAKILNKDRVAFFIGHLYFHIAWQTDVRMFLGKTIVCSLNTFSIKFIQRSFGMEFYINRERKLKLAIDSTLCSYDNKYYYLPLLQKQPPEVFCKK